MRAHYYNVVVVKNVELRGGRTLREQRRPPRIERDPDADDGTHMNISAPEPFVVAVKSKADEEGTIPAPAPAPAQAPAPAPARA